VDPSTVDYFANLHVVHAVLHLLSSVVILYLAIEVVVCLITRLLVHLNVLYHRALAT
jgi:hypothetical protein